MKITISRWQEENCRLQFFVTGIDDQSQKVWITIYCFSQFFAKNGRRLQKKVQSFLLFQHLLLLIFLVVLHEKVCRKVKTWFVIIITSDNRIIFLLGRYNIIFTQMLPKKVSINNIHVFLGTQCRKFRAKKFPVFSNFSN